METSSVKPDFTRDHLDRLVFKIYGIHIQYSVDHFWIDFKNESIEIEFHSDFTDRETSIPLQEFKSWLEEHEMHFLSGYQFQDVDNQGEGEYREIKSIDWFLALNGIQKWQVEKFINDILNK
jgi:hypothetical protein